MSDKLKRYEMEVKCGRWCQGGTAVPDEVTWDDEDWEGYWCKSEDVAKLQTKRDELQARVTFLEQRIRDELGDDLINDIERP